MTGSTYLQHHSGIKYHSERSALKFRFAEFTHGEGTGNVTHGVWGRVVHSGVLIHKDILKNARCALWLYASPY